MHRQRGSSKALCIVPQVKLLHAGELSNMQMDVTSYHLSLKIWNYAKDLSKKAKVASPVLK